MRRCSGVVVTGRKRLLLIEDSAAQGGQLKATLEEFGFEVQWVDSGSAGLQAALEMPPDLVLLDVVMEDVDGFAVCRVLKQHDETCDIPIIMLTVRGDVEDRVVGLEIGADDYLAKPYAEAELRARIAVALRGKDARRELLRRTQQLESKLQHVQALATTDALTGLYNRRRFSEALDHECAVTKRYKSALSFLMLDLGIGHFDSNLRIKNLDRDCIDLNFHWFTTSHLEFVLNARYELIGFGAGGEPGAYALIQAHYRL